MKNEKVVLPNEVTEAIEYYREEGYTDGQIVFGVESGNFGEPLDSYFYDDGRSTDILLRALVLGYTVEYSPEEKVRDYYESYETSSEEAYAIKQTLNLLGMTIKGVNVE